jgi:hypothetical protein
MFRVIYVTVLVDIYLISPNMGHSLSKPVKGVLLCLHYRWGGRV